VKVTVIGASGFIGRHLAAALRARGDAVTETSLRDLDAAAHACEGADAVVNLAGEKVAQRWTKRAKERIRASRVDEPRALIARLRTSAAPPKAYVSASAIGYYGTSEDATFVESSPAGDDFLAGVCVEWEREAAQASAFGARVACVRTGLALGTDGGVLASLLPIFRRGAGGVVASGRQWMSWAHVDDVVGIYLATLDGREGALNATAPHPVRNAEFTQRLAQRLGRAAPLPVPTFALQLLLGEGAEMAAKGQRVLPELALASGYAFRFATLDEALADLLR
jgi:uncharacterized protein (TIGR01777 family)